MRAVVQRALSAEVVVAGEVVGRIDRGLVVFVGVGKDDDESHAVYLAEKVLGLRVFEDEQGKMNRSLADVAGGLLVISQFTLYGDVTRGRRPSFEGAMAPDRAEPIYEAFVRAARTRHTPIATGRFRTEMKVTVENDGPVTLLVYS